MVEPAVSQRVVIQPRVAHVPLADLGMLGSAFVRAMQGWRDHRVLLSGDLGPRGLTHEVIGRQVRPYGHVVPRHEPEARHVDLHIVVPQPAAIPRRVVGRALDHGSAGGNFRAVGEDAAGTAHTLHDVRFGQMGQRLRPVHRRHLRGQVEELRCLDQIGLRRAEWKHGPHLVLLPVEPGDEEHLHGAPAIPVALLVVRRHAPHPRAATPSCHSAVEEHPIVPTFPLDHESDDIHEIASVPSVSGAPRMSYMPSLKKWPRSFISTKAYPRFTAANSALISRGAPLRTSQKLKLYGVRTKMMGYFFDVSLGR